MKAEVTIKFECEMSNEQDLKDTLWTNIKPMMDSYHTAATITIIPKETKFII